jgi:hypothetical protein
MASTIQIKKNNSLLTSRSALTKPPGLSCFRFTRAMVPARAFHFQKGGSI